MTAKWIKELPPGKYDMKQLKEFSRLQEHSSIKIVMLRHGATVEKCKVKHYNFLKDVFTWNGFKKGEKK